MHRLGISIFIFTFAFAVALLFAGSAAEIGPEPVAPEPDEPKAAEPGPGEPNADGLKAAEPGPVTPEDGKMLILREKGLLVLDVRNPNEYVVEHYPDALNIPVNELEARLSEVPSGHPVLVHCAKGRRAERGYEILKESRADIKELYFIKGEPIFDLN